MTSEPAAPPPQPSSSPADDFLNGALRRIRRFMLVLAALGIVLSLVFFRWPVAVGFLLGAVVSYVNHRWLERVVEGLGERITTGQTKERGGGLVFRAMLRYVLIALGAYVIFNVSLVGLYGFLGGVCLPIAAIACEVVVEIFAGLRHGL